MQEAEFFCITRVVYRDDIRFCSQLHCTIALRVAITLIKKFSQVILDFHLLSLSQARGEIVLRKV